MNAMKKHEVDYSQHTIYLKKLLVFANNNDLQRKTESKKRDINRIVT